jgi:hypothetical protein
MMIGGDGICKSTGEGGYSIRWLGECGLKGGEWGFRVIWGILEGEGMAVWWEFIERENE